MMSYRAVTEVLGLTFSWMGLGRALCLQSPRLKDVCVAKASGAQRWAQQNGVAQDELDQVFHIEGEEAEVIAATVPGSTKTKKTLNVYVLVGLAKLLSTGSSNFDDETARKACDTLGCYDAANHSNTLKNKSNTFSGSKDKGWKLTAPGLAHGAALIKEITKTK